MFQNGLLSTNQQLSTPLTTIIIPSTVTYIGTISLILFTINFIVKHIIGDYAFNYCSSISLVLFTIGLTVIGSSMFQMGANGDRSLLHSLVIPSTLTSIGLINQEKHYDFLTIINRRLCILSVFIYFTSNIFEWTHRFRITYVFYE